MDFPLEGLGGRGVVPIFDAYIEESESSSSENAFLIGFRYWLLLTVYSE
jgi:hypothetical protein